MEALAAIKEVLAGMRSTLSEDKHEAFDALLIKLDEKCNGLHHDLDNSADKLGEWFWGELELLAERDIVPDLVKANPELRSRMGKLGSLTSSFTMKAGDVCVIDGLRGREDFNGLRAELIQFDIKKDRWEVACSPGNVKVLVREINLRQVAYCANCATELCASESHNQCGACKTQRSARPARYCGGSLSAPPTPPPTAPRRAPPPRAALPFHCAPAEPTSAASPRPATARAAPPPRRPPPAAPLSCRRRRPPARPLAARAHPREPLAGRRRVCKIIGV